MTFYYVTRDEAITAALQLDHLEFTPGKRWASRSLLPIQIRESLIGTRRVKGRINIQKRH
jgi:hypothetical protein